MSNKRQDKRSIKQFSVLNWRKEIPAICIIEAYLKLYASEKHLTSIVDTKIYSQLQTMLKKAAL